MNRHPSRNVLIVEDDDNLASEMAEGLACAGISIVGRAADRLKALRIVESREVDLVVLDIDLAGSSNGLVVGEELERLYTVPVVFVSAEPERVTTCSCGNPVAVLHKPFDMEDLLDVVLQGIGQRVWPPKPF